MKTKKIKLTDEQRIAKRRERIPVKYRGNYDKAMTGKSRKKAILAKCQDCCCWQMSEVKRCETVDCPLWLYTHNGNRG